MDTYSNPRMTATIDNWPLGGSKRGTAHFEIEVVPGKGQRGTRYTIDPRTGKRSAVKKLTYAVTARILDGDDGHTYIGETTIYGFVNIMQGAMQYQAETVHIDDPRWEPLMLMLGASPARIEAYRVSDRKTRAMLGERTEA